MRRTEGNKRKAAEDEEEESRLRKTVRCLKALGRAEKEKESDKAQEVVEVAEVEVNEEEEEWMTEEDQRHAEEGATWTRKFVRVGRKK